MKNMPRKVLVCWMTCLMVASAVSCLAQVAGYDENTEIMVRGTVQRPSAAPYLGLFNFYLKSDWKIFKVLTAPPWFVKRSDFSLKPRQDVEVIGSKFYGPDGTLCILAKSVKLLPSGKVVSFRDPVARPVWYKHRCPLSCMRIFLPASSK